VVFAQSATRRGNGFITPDDGSKYLFSTTTGISGEGFKSLSEEQRSVRGN